MFLNENGEAFVLDFAYDFAQVLFTVFRKLPAYRNNSAPLKYNFFSSRCYLYQTFYKTPVGTCSFSRRRVLD